MRCRMSIVLLACAVSAVLAAASPANADPLNMWTEGHGDLGFAYEDDEWEPHLHLEGPGVVIGGVEQAPDFDEEFEPDEIWIVVPNSTVRARDANILPVIDWSDIGVGEGELFWTLPEASSGSGGFNSTDLQTPFVGHATEELDPVDWVGDITLEIVEVTSPSGSGTYSLFNGLLAPTFVASVTDDAGGDIVNPSGDSFMMAPGIHTHFNIGFTEPGHWEVTYQMTGEHVVDGVVSDTGTFEFKVVPEPATISLMLSGCALLIVGAVRRRRNR